MEWRWQGEAVSPRYILVPQRQQYTNKSLVLLQKESKLLKQHIYKMF